MYHFTLVVCLSSALICSAYLIQQLPAFGGGLIAAASQAFVYLAIAMFARLSRSSSGLAVVMGMALLASFLSLAICRAISQLAAPIAFACFLAQLVVSIVGCYVGYMFVEARRLSENNPNALVGKVTVIMLVAAGVTAISLCTIALYNK